MSKLSLLEIAQSQLDKTPVIDGQLIVCLDTGNAYRDTATAHVKIGSDLEVVSDLPLAPLAEKIYYLKPDKLYAYLGGNWTLLNDKAIDLDKSIAKLPAGSSTSLNDDVEIIAQDTDITQSHYYRRKLVVLWEYIKTKAQDFFAAKNHKHGKADITDFPTSMPASDVYPWAKAATKPSYTKAEVGLGKVDNTADADKTVKRATTAGTADSANSVTWENVKNKPTAFPVEAHTHDDRYYTEAEVNSKLSDKVDNTEAGANGLINKLSTADGIPNDATVFISQHNDGKTASYYRRPISTLWTYIKSKADGVYQPKGSYAASGHTHDDRYYTESEMNAKFDGKLSLSGGTLSGNIHFADIGSAGTSSGITWDGSTDGAGIYYQTTSADQGNLVLNLTDDYNCYLRIAQNGNFKSYFSPNDGNFHGNVNGTADVANVANFAKETYINQYKTVNLTDLDQNTWYPVTGTGVPYNGLRHFKCNVQLNSGSKPNWSTHSSGFTAVVDILEESSGWGTTRMLGEVLINDQYFIADENKPPVGYQQMSYGSVPVWWLRGGGTYFLAADYDCTWTIQKSKYENSGQSVAPTTTYPGVNVNRATITANLEGNAKTATMADIANSLSGLSSRSSQGWGVQTGTFIHGEGDTTGGDFAFRRDCPNAGQLSMVLDGRFYQNEGQYRVLDESDKNQFATAGHTHNSVKDIGDNSNTTFAYSKAGMNYGDYTWLAGWNGYEMRAVNKNQFAITGHTHTKDQVGLGNVDNTADANKSVKYATSAGNASKVNNHTVNIDVPANAKFTDTIYGVATASSNGLMSSTDKTKLDDFSRVISIQKQIKLTTDWQDVGISGEDLETGTYVVQVSGFNSEYTQLYYEIYSGIMSWYASKTNDLNNDEIFLHNAGHASNSNDIYLRTSRRLNGNGDLHLQIACKVAATGTDTLTFKFRRLI